MKAERRHAPGARHEQRTPPKREDSYLATAKVADPATCPRCHATYIKGRWTWHKAPEGAAQLACPACRRTEDNFPAGYVTIAGAFAAQHRDEIMALVNARADRARREHPMQRVIAVEATATGTVLTTTDGRLARSIGIALRNAFEGSLSLDFFASQNLVRATWKR